MKPKIADEIPEEVWGLLGRVRKIIADLPATIEAPTFITGVRVGTDIAISHIIPDCHTIARALAAFLPVNLHDGVVLVKGADGETRELRHSWFTIRNHDPRIILDPWPLGVVSGPALFIQDYAYHFGPECSFLEHREERFLCHVDAVTQVVRSIIEQH